MSVERALAPSRPIWPWTVLTTFPDYDGFGPGFQLLARISFADAIVSGQDQIYLQNSTGPVADTINTVLMVDATVQPGSTLSLTATLLAQITSGHGFIDLSHTGELFLVASDGLTLTPSDERYLSDPAFNPNITPLPASLPLFATGLGALGLLGWRRKRKNAAVAA